MKFHFLEFSAVLLIFIFYKIIRYVYLGYVKAPRQIQHFQVAGNEVKVKEWQDFMINCKQTYLPLTIILALVFLVVAAIGFG